MSVSENLPVAEATQPAGRWAARWEWFEQHLIRLGDHLNPILVKETRQALKSRQFIFTFATLLIASWFTSIMGLAFLGPTASMESDGPILFVWYIIALGVALLVAVPRFAFQSLASEREDRTYELLQITRLSAIKIVGGKLAIAVLQMLIYLSAIAPCLAFTYLLRGIDLPTILYYLAALCLMSICGSVLGLMFGSLAERGVRQWSLQGIFMLGLLGFMFGMIGVAFNGMSFNLPWDNREFWIVNMGFLLFLTTTAALFFLAAAANLNFPSSNRSTPQRWAMVVQQIACVGMFGWIASSVHNFPADGAYALVVFSGVYWYVMGVFLTGESPVLSPRVKRSLPSSTLGRIFLTWMHPGPTTGYVLCICGVASAAIMGVVLAVSHDTSLATLLSQHYFWAVAAVLSYVIIYLAAGKWLLGVMRLAQHPSPVQRVIVHLLVVILFTAVPLLIDWTVDGYRNYSLIETTNAFWTLEQLLGRKTGAADESVVVLGIAAFIVFGLQLRSIARELDYVRMRPPQRVEEEEANLAPKAPPRPQNPWDELPG